jgi:hypothetical protein
VGGERERERQAPRVWISQSRSHSPDARKEPSESASESVFVSPWSRRSRRGSARGFNGVAAPIGISMEVRDSRNSRDAEISDLALAPLFRNGPGDNLPSPSALP